MAWFTGAAGSPNDLTRRKATASTLLTAPAPLTSHQPRDKATPIDPTLLPPATAAGSADALGAATAAAAKQRKRAMAGSTLLTKPPKTSATPSLIPLTLIGY